MQLQQGKKHWQPPHLSGWVLVCVWKYALPHTFIHTGPQRSAHLNVQSTIVGETRDEMRGKHRKMKRKGRKGRKDKSG